MGTRLRRRGSAGERRGNMSYRYKVTLEIPVNLGEGSPWHWDWNTLLDCANKVKVLHVEEATKPTRKNHPTPIYCDDDSGSLNNLKGAMKRRLSLSIHASWLLLLCLGRVSADLLPLRASPIPSCHYKIWWLLLSLPQAKGCVYGTSDPYE